MRDLKQPLMIQMRRLADQADVRLVGFCSALVGLDLVFIAVSSAYTVAAALFSENTPQLGLEWRIGKDWSYAEMLGYVKLVIIVSALASIRAKRQRPIYVASALLFAVVLLDDALRLHERLGGGLVNLLAVEYSVLGELMVWTFLGVFLLAISYAASVRSPEEDRANGLVLLGGLAVLVWFAVVADIGHVVLLHEFKSRGVDRALTIVEDGGEQITLSLICGVALLVHRELRSRLSSS